MASCPPPITTWFTRFTTGVSIWWCTKWQRNEPTVIRRTVLFFFFFLRDVCKFFLLTWSMMGEMAAELTGLSVLKVLMWSRDVESNSWEETGDRQHSVIKSDVKQQQKKNKLYTTWQQKKRHLLTRLPSCLLTAVSKGLESVQGGLTLAVLSLEALMNIVRSTDGWMSLICLLCSLAFFRISPDCP